MPASARILAVSWLLGCRSVPSGAPAELGVVGPEPTPSVAPAALAPTCHEFLAQLRCWLKASGNDAAEVTRAVGNSRASFEARPDSAASCERAMVFRHELIASTGCAHAGAEGAELPAAAAVACGAGEHFFVRRDGHVSGCRRDCTLPTDCPAPTACSGLGSAAGGPIDERFCE